MILSWTMSMPCNLFSRQNGLRQVNEPRYYLTQQEDDCLRAPQSRTTVWGVEVRYLYGHPHLSRASALLYPCLAALCPDHRGSWL